jgi:hypothetical protein
MAPLMNWSCLFSDKKEWQHCHTYVKVFSPCISWQEGASAYNSNLHIISKHSCDSHVLGAWSQYLTCSLDHSLFNELCIMCLCWSNGKTCFTSVDKFLSMACSLKLISPYQTFYCILSCSELRVLVKCCKYASLSYMKLSWTHFKRLWESRHCSGKLC